MSDLAERFEVLVETFARKLAALAVDAAEQKGRADRAEAEVDRLRREYEPGYPAARDASVDAPMLDEERRELCDEINKWKRRYFLVADAVAAESESAEQLADIARAMRAELAAEKKRADTLSVAVANVSGALVDAGSVRVPDEEAEYGGAVREIVAKLAAANAEIARLTRAANSARKDADAVRAEALRNADEDTNAWARAKLAEAAHAAIKAKLGRAVAALATLDHDQAWYDERDAILADGTQVAAAWREFLAAYASHNQRGEDGPCECEYCKAFGALAAVDARRGTVKP